MTILFSLLTISTEVGRYQRTLDEGSEHADVRLTRPRPSPNSDKVVHLYNYLLAGAAPCAGVGGHNTDRKNRTRSARMRIDQRGVGPRGATLYPRRAGHPHRDTPRVRHKLGGRRTLIRDRGSESK